MSDGYRPPRIEKTFTRVIHMPRWGVERVILKEIVISLPRVSLIDGPVPSSSSTIEEGSRL